MHNDKTTVIKNRNAKMPNATYNAKIYETTSQNKTMKCCDITALPLFSKYRYLCPSCKTNVKK